MVRSTFSFSIAVATATVILAAGTRAVSAQTASSTSASTAPAAAPAPQYPELQEAVQLFRQRKFAECFSKLKEASRRYPELPSAHVLMFNFFLQAKQEKDAHFWLEKGVNETPSDPEPYTILGSFALAEHRIAEAAMDFEKAQQLLAAYPNPKRKEELQLRTIFGIAQVAESREDWRLAEAHLREFLKLAPNDLEAHRRLAHSLFWQTKVQEAYDVLKDGKKIDNENAAKPGGREQFLTPEAIMASYYDEFETQPSKNPEIWYLASLKKAPNDLQTRFEVAKWALKKGRLDLVKEQAEAALRIEKEDSANPPASRKYSGSTVGRMLRGLVALWDKDWPEAERYFRMIILDSPNDFGAQNNIALALVSQADPVKQNLAKEYAEANFKDNQNNLDALSTLMWVYFKRGDFQSAGLVFNQLIKATGGNLGNPDTATYIAYMFHHDGQDLQAKTVLDEILKTERPFSMRPEAKDLYERVKDAKKPDAPKAP